RFSRAGAVADAVRESVRAALTAGGFLKSEESYDSALESFDSAVGAGGLDESEKGSDRESVTGSDRESEMSGDRENVYATAPTRPYPHATSDSTRFRPPDDAPFQAAPRNTSPAVDAYADALARRDESRASQESIEFGSTPTPGELTRQSEQTFDHGEATRERGTSQDTDAQTHPRPQTRTQTRPQTSARAESGIALPPLNSAAGLMRDGAAKSLTSNIRPLGQLEDSFIIATDAEGLLLIDQRGAHERILFDKYRRLEASRRPDSQSLLVPETFDLTPAQAAAFGEVSDELERLGFSLMRLSGRTVAVRAIPADLPATEARNLLSEILDTVDGEKRGRARESLRDEIAASLARRAALKLNTALTQEKMRWLIDHLLLTSSPTTCPHGHPIILRLTKRDIERGFHRA
ncbi:MAG: mismatch repair protein MutL, partial [Acidobacteriota bacterium]|nr:mismatch repair protein MutL [Acidobacteriota bacterium]